MGSLIPAAFFFFHNIYTRTFVFCMGNSMHDSFFFFHIFTDNTSLIWFLWVIRSITCRIRLYPFLLCCFNCSLYFISPLFILLSPSLKGLFNLRAIFGNILKPMNARLISAHHQIIWPCLSQLIFLYSSAHYQTVWPCFAWVKNSWVVVLSSRQDRLALLVFKPGTKLQVFNQ